METRKIQKYKIDKVKELKEMISGANDVLLADYRGLTVEQITELRGQLRQNNATMTVVKNNLAKIAFRELEIKVGDEYFKGPTAMTLVRSDVGPVAKVLFEYTKNSPLQLKGGIVGGKVFPADQVENLSKLPNKETLIAMLMGTMNAPLTNLMYAMNGVASKLVRTLKAVADKKAGE